MNATDRFSQCIVVRNPVSTRAHSTHIYIAALREAFPHAKITIVETVAGGRDKNKELLRAHAELFGEGTLLCIAAGDGTVNMVVEALLSDPTLPAAARQTTVLPLWGGNANDLAHMLNGGVRRRTLVHMLQTAQRVAIYPLAFQLTAVDGSSHMRLAACYASFGASAFTSHMFGTPEQRTKVASFRLLATRYSYELLHAIQSMRRAPVFSIVEDETAKTVYERIFFKGPRFAKVSGVRRRLTDKSFHVATVERKAFADVMFAIMELGHPKRSGKFEAMQTNFIVKTATWAQFDGETMRIEAGTHVSVRLAAHPFYAHTTRLSPKT